MTTGNATWKASAVKTWLNDKFYKMAFNKQEQSMMLDFSSAHERDSKPISLSDGEEKVKVSLLTVKEAIQLFSSDATRKVYMLEDTSSIESCAWWLRSKGAMSDFISYVDNGGAVIESGCGANYQGNAVRPVILVRPPVHGEIK